MLGPGHSGVTCRAAGVLAPPQNAGLWDWAELQGGLSASRSPRTLLLWEGRGLGGPAHSTLGPRGLQSPEPVWLTGSMTLYPGGGLRLEVWRSSGP